MTGIGRLDPSVASAFFGRFTEIRPVQEAAVEPILAGRNVVLSSGTGTGKTEAIMAPLLTRFWRRAARSQEVVILYVAPTKALVNDLEKRLSPPLGALGLDLGIRHGDRDDVARGARPHVLITTPESLDVMLSRSDPALQSIQAVVIDEVHLLYNTQRGMQLSVLLRRLEQVTPHPLQTVMLSATIGRLADVTSFVLGDRASAELLSFPSDRTIDAHIRHIRNEQALLQLVTRLIEGRPTKLLVFANSRRECERLAGVLARDESLAPNVFTHYSSLSSDVRVETETKFMARRTAVCLATSTLELGIDIGDVDAVVLWGAPGSVDSFLQRIGRGNRRSNKANVVCLIPDNDMDPLLHAMRFLALIDASRRGLLPVRSPFELYGAVAQQLLDVVAANGGRYTRVADLCALFDHRGCYSRPVVETILAGLADQGYLLRHGFKNRYGAGERLHSLLDYRMIYGNFAVGSQKVDVLFAEKHLGEVPTINLLRVRSGQTVRFVGKHWRVTHASSQGIRLTPEGADGEAADFVYPGAGIGWDPFLTDRIWGIMLSNEIPYSLLQSSLADRLREFIEDVRSRFSQESIPFERTPEGICYSTFAGYLVNRAIALVSGKAVFRADDRTLTVPSPIEWATIPTSPEEYQPVFDQLFEASSEQSLYQSLLPPEFQRHEFLQAWLKDEAIPRVLRRLSVSTPVPNHA